MNAVKSVTLSVTLSERIISELRNLNLELQRFNYSISIQLRNLRKLCVSPFMCKRNSGMGFNTISSYSNNYSENNNYSRASRLINNLEKLISGKIDILIMAFNKLRKEMSVFVQPYLKCN